MLFRRKITNRTTDAQCTGSSNCSICQIFPESKTRCERTQKGELRLRRRSSLISKRKCGSRYSGFSRCANFGDANLGDKYFIKLQEIIPYSWLLDPTPLPQHAVIPRLEIHDWREAAKFSQKDRDLLLKVSGFSPLGWGSRGVALGSDLPHADWEKRIEHALATFESSPTILQRFHKGRLFEHSYWDPDSREVKVMKGRVRLCPYYFVEADRVKLRGALATIVPADKKFLHGMSDAILVPSKAQL